MNTVIKFLISAILLVVLYWLVEITYALFIA
jgi:hypothetical protein